MARKEKLFMLTQTEIISWAIKALYEYCNKIHEDTKKAMAQDPELGKMMEDAHMEYFEKLNKLLELYELQTGNEYGMDIRFD